MNTELIDFNPIEMLQTQDEIIEYLVECYRDEDPSTFTTALGFLAKHHGMTSVAKEAGLSRESLYKAFNGKTQPKWSTVVSVMKALNINVSFA